MRSLGWYILGYFGLGALVWIVGAIVIAIAAAVSDYKWDSENDPSMKRTDTLDALNSVSDDAIGDFEDYCNLADNARAAKVWSYLSVWAKWPWTLPQGFSIIWNRAVELRNRRR